MSMSIEIKNLVYERPGTFRIAIPNLTLQAGERVILTGSSGSGKTTLLQLIAGILPPSRGSINLNEVALTTLTKEQRQAFRLQNIGLISQDLALLNHLSVLENILIQQRLLHKPDLNSLTAQAKNLLEAVDLPGVDNRRPTELSQGERQRVAQCRALIGQPPLILADEPTGSLDPDRAQAMIIMLLEQAKAWGSTVVLISHDHSHITYFDRHVDMHDICQVGSGQGAGHAS